MLFSLQKSLKLWAACVLWILAQAHLIFTTHKTWIQAILEVHIGNQGDKAVIFMVGYWRGTCCFEKPIQNQCAKVSNGHVNYWYD